MHFFLKKTETLEQPNKLIHDERESGGISDQDAPNN